MRYNEIPQLTETRVSDPFDEDDDEYFPEYVEGAELTGKEPKFLKLEQLAVRPEDIATMKVDDLILMYREMRDQLATERKAWKQREEVVKGRLQVISMALRDRGDSIGVDSFATAVGTAFRQLKEKFPIVDWAAFTDWLHSTMNYQAVQKRASPNAIKEIRDERKAELLAKGVSEEDITDELILPPGVGVIREIEFAVRSPTARKSTKKSA